MRPFAFYGRVSTEDQQDPESSKGWQVARSKTLIEPHGGEIVTEFFDIGLSRSLPWKRRPQASSLLAALRQPDRGFTAVVIGEPARAFYGNQFGLTFPLFEHYGVELWVPEVGGAIDPGSDAHDLVMSLYGGMSKGERNRIKIRVRTAMAAQAATEGRFLGGRPPYGYQLADRGPHPNPGKAAVGQRLHQLEPDPTAAAIVQRIFAEYLAGRGLYAIAEGLTRERVPCPSAHDPARNRHRSGQAWSKAAVRVILHNPRYTGRQVWNKQRKDEVLIDVEDVALGHQAKLRWNPETDWIWSAQVVHEALIDADVFVEAQTAARASSRRTRRMPRATRRPYALRGLIHCGICQRRMEGTWAHDAPRYRCKYPTEYALANHIDHPRTVYVREDAILPQLDGWLAGLFAPSNLDATLDALMAAADEPDSGLAAAATAARRARIDCDARIAKYRAALEAGADPALVAGWLAEVQTERVILDRQLRDVPVAAGVRRDDLAVMVRRQAEAVALLKRASHDDKSRLYVSLGLRLTYQPDHRRVLAACQPGHPCTTERVRGGT